MKEEKEEEEEEIRVEKSTTFIRVRKYLLNKVRNRHKASCMIISFSIIILITSFQIWVISPKLSYEIEIIWGEHGIESIVLYVAA
jgi:hypothetical protein